jgi:hypothetical protein
LAWFIVFAGLFLSFIFFKDKLLSRFNRQKEKIEDYNSTPDISSLPKIQTRFGGKLRLPSKKKADFWLTIKSLKPIQDERAVFVYAIRIDSLTGDYRYYNEKEQVGELILKDRKIKLQSKEFPDWEYDQDSKGKITLKSLNVELELE